MAFDLATLDARKPCDAGYDLELRHPDTDAPLGIFFQIYGKESAAFRETSTATANAMLRRQFEQQRKGKDAKAPTVEDADERAVRLLAACTFGWFTKDGDDIVKTITFGGAPMTFSTDEAARIYANPGFSWLRAQVDEAIGDLGNFMKG